MQTSYAASHLPTPRPAPNLLQTLLLNVGSCFLWASQTLSPCWELLPAVGEALWRPASLLDQASFPPCGPPQSLALFFSIPRNDEALLHLTMRTKHAKTKMALHMPRGMSLLGTTRPSIASWCTLFFVSTIWGLCCCEGFLWVWNSRQTLMAFRNNSSGP